MFYILNYHHIDKSLIIGIISILQKDTNMKKTYSRAIMLKLQRKANLDIPYLNKTMLAVDSCMKLDTTVHPAEKTKKSDIYKKNYSLKKPSKIKNNGPELRA